MGSWDVPGRCDIRTMSYVINSHLRRHETYRSWFEYKDRKNIVRHTIANPRDIEFVPTKYGVMTPTEWHDLLMSTPDPLHWDCFSFGIIQYEEHFAAATDREPRRVLQAGTRVHRRADRGFATGPQVDRVRGAQRRHPAGLSAAPR
jgi:hypothetical protein